MRRIIFLALICSPLLLHAQVDPAKLDSLSKKIEQQNKVVKAWQDSFTRRQDSIYEARTRASRHTTPLPPGAVPEEKKDNTTLAAIIICCLVLLAFLLYLILRKKQRRP
jgi:hypothetical protein